MAFVNVGTTVVCDAGPNVIPGPLWIKGLVVPTSTTLLIKDSTGTTTVASLAAGTYTDLEFRATKGFSFTGACTLFLRVR